MDRDLILAEAETSITAAVEAPLHLKTAAVNEALRATRALLRMMFFEIEKLQEAADGQS